VKYPDDFVNKIICGDCLDVMRYIPDKSVDLVFYDPPYNVKKKYDGYSDSMPEDVYTEWMKKVAIEADRVSIRGVLVYISGTLTKKFFGILPKSHLIVVHKRAAGVCSGNYMLQYHSLLSTAKPVVKCKDLWDDVRLPGEGYYFREQRYDSPGLTGRLLIEKALHHFSVYGDVVLDPFIGTGTTAHACKNMARKYIGIEQSERYCKIAINRIDQLEQADQLCQHTAH
jgi:16S rRNA G966 N2-methylase RsmD